MDGFSKECDETALSDGDINRLLELHKEYAENSLKYLSALETDKQNVKGFVKHPQTSRKICHFCSQWDIKRLLNVLS